MISCRRVSASLVDYASGELSAEDSRRLERHLCGCPLCALDVEAYLTTIRQAKVLPVQPLPPGLVERLRKLIAEVWQAPPPTGGPLGGAA
jgi:anti-sigma factor RsiW